MSLKWLVIFGKKQYLPLRLSAIALLLLSGLSAQAFDVPPPGSSVAIQTNAPNAPLGSGDFYTSVTGSNQGHEMNIIVPCTWTAGVPLTFAILDPEVNVTSADPPDQIRSATPDVTRFTLIAPGGATVASPTFTSGGGSNNRWVELATIDPAVTGCGTYQLIPNVGDGNPTVANSDDENGWRLRVAHDPDCTVSIPGPGTCSGIGAAQSTLLNDGDQRDDSDGIAGNGDELVAGSLRITYEPSATACQDFFFFVDGLTPNITLHNFDMDVNAFRTVNYIRPNGTTIAGVASGDSRWNGGVPGAPAVRVGDTIAVTAADAGWWRGQVCTNTPNQYIFEGITGGLTFLQQPLTPNITLTKSDGGATVSAAGGNITYTLTYSNIGNGAATNVVLTDNLPAGATFVNCTGGCTGAGPVTWNLGIVPAGATANLTLTIAVPASAPGTVFTNNASAAYQDSLGNTFPPATAQDTTTSVGAPLMTLTKSDGVATIGTAGATVTYTLTYANTGTADATNVTITDNLPAGTTFASCTGGCTGTGPVNWNIGTVAPAAGGGVTLTVNLPASAAGTVFTNTATLNYQDPLGAPQPAVDATDVTTVAGAGGGPVPPTGGSDGASVNNPNNAAAGQVAGASAVNPLLTIVDPFITKNVNPPFAIPGEAVTWTIIITNPGTIPFNNVNFQDSMPSEVQITSVVATSGTTSTNGQVVSFSQGTVNPGQSVTITINTRVRNNAVTPFVLRNQVCFTADSIASRCATAPNVLSVGSLPSTGLSPWSQYRLPLIMLTGVISLLAGLIGLRGNKQKHHTIS